MAGRKASTLCSPATLSQCAIASRESRLPCRAPLLATRMNTICRHLVWHRYFPLERLCTHFDLFLPRSRCLSSTVKCDGNRRGSPMVFGSSEWVGSPRQDTLAEPSAILSVASRWFPSGSACSLNGAQNFKEPPGLAHPV